MLHISSCRVLGQTFTLPSLSLPNGSVRMTRDRTLEPSVPHDREHEPHADHAFNWQSTGHTSLPHDLYLFKGKVPFHSPSVSTGHGLPCPMVGCVILRVMAFCPPSHVTEHGPHVDHCVNAQSCAGGHLGWKHVSAVSSGGHSAAPSACVGRSIRRTLARVPSSHVTEHSVHSDQSVTRQSPDLHHGHASKMYVRSHVAHVRPV